MKAKGEITVLMVCVAFGMSLMGCTERKNAQESAFDNGETGDSISAVAEEGAEEAFIPHAADELFDDFFFNFAANKGLQRKRIQYPLPIYKGDVVTSKVNKGAWTIEQFFMPEGYYTLIFDKMEQVDIMKDTLLNHVVVEKIFLDKDDIKQFFFDRINGEWMMTSIKQIPIDESPNGSFLNFYRRFCDDEDYQLQSVNDLVTFSAPDPDDDFNTITGMMVPEQWPAFKPSLIPRGTIYNINYGQMCTESNEKVFLIRGIANGLESEMIFHRKNGVWKLIKFMS
ncbi:MAG: DUF4348 domain-containing protein [Prevotella sp.]|nr:DUF4348 domain-containing protein [Prevotella sp.]